MSGVAVLLWTMSVIGVSAMVHEFGHAWAARYCGWRVIGFKWSWYGAGCVVEVGNVRDMWKVALGGPFATAGLAMAFLAASGASSSLVFGQLLEFGFTLNASVLLINLLPVSALDGGRIMRSLRRVDERSTTQPMRLYFA